MPVVVDDHLLVSLLSSEDAASLATEQGAAIYATGCWYYRLARAAARPGDGAISSRLAALTGDEQERLRQGLEELPSGIGLLSWRSVVPVMAALRTRQPLNLLSAEALAVCLLTSSSLLVHVESPPLRAGSGELGIEYRLRT